MPRVLWSPAVAFVMLLWLIIVCDPQYLLAHFGLTFMPQVTAPLFAVLLVMIVFHWPRHWNAPLLVWFLFAAAMFPLAQNRYYAEGPTKALVLYYVLTVGTVTFIHRPRQALAIIVLYFLAQYVWWIVLGVQSGLVTWDPTFDNYDGYGPLMDVAIPATFYFGLAVKDRRLKWLALITSAGAVIGLVSAFKRGAMLAGAAVALFMWIRAPARNKGTITLALIAAVGLVLLGARLFSGTGHGGTKRAFWDEMMSAVTQTQEHSGTAEDRRVLWQLARREFRANPVIGVGAGNFGVYAATHFLAGTVGGDYDRNPGKLYDRALHNDFFQVLCEYGLVGSVILVWLLGDFWVKNRRLLLPAFNANFDAALGGSLSLRYLAFGLQGSMVGFLVSGFFYNTLYVHWLYTLAGMNILLYELARPRADRVTQVRTRRLPTPRPASAA
jgi:O-antigen ligase